MDNSNIILRLKKTIIFTEKNLDNFPRNEFVLKNRIIDAFYTILELTYSAYVDSENKNKIVKEILVKIRMIDFYLQISLDKEIISRKNLKNISLHLRDITSMYYAWLNCKNEKI